MALFSALRGLGVGTVDGEPDRVRPLRQRPCRSLCSWHRTPVVRDGEPQFACRGCGSQWVPSEDWTPIDDDGTINDEIRDLRRA